MKNLKNIQSPFTVIIFVGVFLVACQKSSNSKESGLSNHLDQSGKSNRPEIRVIPPTDYTTNLKLKDSDSKLAYQALRNVCNKIENAYFQEDTKTCECNKANESPNFFEKKCNSNTKTWGIDNKRKFLDNVEILHDPYHKSSLEALEFESPEIQSKLPQIFEPGFNIILNYPKIFLNHSSITVFEAISIAAQADKEFLFNTTLSTQLNYYADEVNDIPGVLGDLSGIQPRRGFWEISDRPIEFNFERGLSREIKQQYQDLRLVAKAIYDQFQSKEFNREKFEPSDFFVYTKQGCLDYCYTSAEIEPNENVKAVIPQFLDLEDLKFEWNRHYVSGNIVYQHLMVSKRSNQDRVVQVQLNFSLAPSFILLYSFLSGSSYFENEQLTTVRTIGYFNKNWELLSIKHDSSDNHLGHLYTFPDYFIGDTLMRAEKQREKTLEILDHKGDYSLAVISEQDHHLQTMDKIGLLESILMGPYQLQDKTLSTWLGSVLGWNPNPNSKFTRAFTFFSAESSVVFGNADRILSVSDQKKAHDLNVFLKYKSTSVNMSDHHKIIPIRRDELYEDYELWSPAVIDAGVQTVNASFLKKFDAFVCQRIIGKVIDDSLDKFLWVLASGNDGISGIPSYSCPQNLEAKENILIVAATEGNQLSHISNYGTDYADVGADGRSPFPENGEVGTSFAAPVVTAVAAEINRVYPNLSPRKVRLTIMLGAQIPNFSPLKVRSGGIVTYSDIHKYLLIAEKMAMPSYSGELTTQKAEDMLKLIISDPRELKLKLDILIQNQVLNSNN